MFFFLVKSHCFKTVVERVEIEVAVRQPVTEELAGRIDAEYLSDDVVEVVQCDTLAALRYHFIGPNQQLYQQLQTDQEGGNAPDVGWGSGVRR